MINSYRSREIIEALRWDGNNKDELEDFVGKDNVDFIIYTNKPSVPAINVDTKEEILSYGDFVYIKDDKIVIESGDDFLQNFESMN